jgi:prepilin-type N-terminal cleavage/methylation domain-containing protein
MNTRGFTIIELLIVIVVIGILAAISIVAYNGVQSRAKNAQYKSDIATIVKKVELYPAAHGGGLYPLSSAGNDESTATTQTPAGLFFTAAVNYVTETRLPSNIVFFGVLADAAATPTNAQATVAATANTNARGYFVKYCSTGRGMYIFYPDTSLATGVPAPSVAVGVCP